MPEQASLKQRIHRGDIIVGVSVPMHIERGRLEDVLSRDTYGFVTVDSQHSAYNEERLVTLCAMAEEVGIPVQFRIKHTRQAYLTGNILDLVPHHAGSDGESRSSFLRASVIEKRQSIVACSTLR